MKNQLLSILVLVSLLGGAPLLAGVSEPDTVLYGRIVNRTSGQIYQLSEGTLTWTFRPSDRTPITVSAQILPLKDGEYSYRLNVPHQALSLGLEVSTSALPLTIQSSPVNHLQISVDGFPARILPPGHSAFDVSQATRAATYRIDLEVSSPLNDLDGDGLPDWWESRFMMDNPNSDPDSDGWNNLAEFRRGSNPTRDDRMPALGTTEIRAYADGTTALTLQGIDADSSAANLTYTLTRRPEIGRIYLRNARTGPYVDQVLGNGASFSQADVDAGRLIYVHRGESIRRGTSFQVTLHDENLAHPFCTGKVAVVFYRPAAQFSSDIVAEIFSPMPRRLPALAGVAASEQQLAANYLLSREMNYVISDSSGEARNLTLAAPSAQLTPDQYQTQYLSTYGPDRPHVLFGGSGSDQLNGGMESDVLIGSGGDDTLRGNGGGDVFLFSSPTDGNDTVADFTPAEGDIVDISRLLIGPSVWVTNYVRLVPDGTNSLLRLSFDGTAGSYADSTLILAGLALSQSDLYDLIECGALHTGDKVSPARVALAAGVPLASENGPSKGIFTLTRGGSTQSDLTVNLQVTGSAANGVDYVFVNSRATFLPGERSIDLEITPYADTMTELAEVVRLTLLAGEGYEIGATASGSVTIEDLAPQITIEALEPTAVKANLTSGLLLVSRSGVLDRSVLVRLDIAGTASRSTDFEGVPSFVNLPPGQTTELIEVRLRSTAVLSNGVESVDVTIRPDPTYKLGNPSSARVLLLDEQLVLASWRDRHFAGTSGDLMSFASDDPGHTGFNLLQRYAFGLDPRAPQNSSGRPTFAIRDGHLTVSYRQPFSVTDVRYFVEVSEDLVTWHLGEAFVEPITLPETANQPEIMTYQVKRSINADRVMFVRVRTVYAP